MYSTDYLFVCNQYATICYEILCTMKWMYLQDISKMLVWISLGLNYRTLVEVSLFEIIHQWIREYAMAAILSCCPCCLLPVQPFVICINKSPRTIREPWVFLLSIHNRSRIYKSHTVALRWEEWHLVPLEHFSQDDLLELTPDSSDKAAWHIPNTAQ